MYSTCVCPLLHTVTDIDCGVTVCVYIVHVQNIHTIDAYNLHPWKTLLQRYMYMYMHVHKVMQRWPVLHSTIPCKKHVSFLKVLYSRGINSLIITANFYLTTCIQHTLKYRNKLSFWFLVKEFWYIFLFSKPFPPFLIIFLNLETLFNFFYNTGQEMYAKLPTQIVKKKYINL